MRECKHFHAPGVLHEPCKDCLIEQQAARIAELEASLASMVQGVKISIPTQTIEQEFQSHCRRGYEAGKAALRQRIADAPKEEPTMTNDELTNAINQTHKLISATAQREPPYEGLCKHLSELLLIQQRRAAVEPLISKEDLK